MKKYLFLLSLTALAATAWLGGRYVLAQVETVDVTSEMPSPHLVISQFQPGTTANANDEYVEIKNTGASPVDLNGYRLVYRSQNGTNDVGPFAVWTTSTVLQPGQYYLVASTSYTGAPTPDITYNPSVCLCSMSATNGGLAIRQGDMNTGAIIDAVGWGTGSNIFFENTRTVAPGSGNSQARKQNGCQDSDNNANDFETLSPFAPRNTSTAPITCSGTGTSLFASMSANPTTVSPPGSTLLTVTVIPATTPPSTGITVVGNLTNIGGSANQTFFDNGTNGDVTPGDNVFSYQASIAAGTPGGTATVTAIAQDAQARTANTGTNVTINAPPANEDPLIFGNPSNATSDVANENNYLMQKPPYSMSYNRSKATTNWTAWRLDTSWIGSANDGSFAPDTTLPAGWYQVQPGDYTGSGFDRGHMCPSGDRTNTQFNNDLTFLMTNIIPQLSANNQGPWVDLENYCRTLASQGNEVYIISGPHGIHQTTPTIGGGRVTVPKTTWKVVLVLPNGANDLQRASSRSTRVFGVIMSNESISMSAPWRNFRVTVDEVEALTGYNFFSNLPKNTQELIERRRDTL